LCVLYIAVYTVFFRIAFRSTAFARRCIKYIYNNLPADAHTHTHIYIYIYIWRYFTVTYYIIRTTVWGLNRHDLCAAAASTSFVIRLMHCTLFTESRAKLSRPRLPRWRCDNNNNMFMANDIFYLSSAIYL